MPSEVSICNMALQKLGNEAITALSEDSKRARACNLYYDINRDAILAAFPWNGCVKRARLARLAEEPEWGFSYKYQLPADCLRVLRAFDDESAGEDDTYEITYQVESRELLTDATEVYVKYIKREEDPNKYSPLLIEAMACRLAVQLVYNLAASTTLREQAFQEYDLVLREARKTDGREGTTRQKRQLSSWLEGRRGGAVPDLDY